MAHQLSYARRILAPAMRVAVTPLQEARAAIALAGPAARGLIAELAGGEAPPGHMQVARLHDRGGAAPGSRRQL